MATNPGWVLGYVPSPTEWNNEWSIKADEFNATLTGTPTAPTPPYTDNTTRIATTAWVTTYVANNPSVPTFATIAALRANTAVTGVCFVANYSVVGDLGGGLFQTVASDVTSTDNSGTIIVDTGGHRWYRVTNGAAANVRWFGARGDGVTSDQTAFANCFATHPRAVYIPAGDYVLTGLLTYTLPGTLVGLSIVGDGPDVSRLIWANTHGLKILTFDRTNAVLVRGLTFITGAAGAWDGLTLQCNNPSGPFGDVVGQRDIENCVFRGTDGYQASQYWALCLNIYDVSTTNITACFFTAPNELGIGAWAQGPSGFAPCIFNFTGCTWTGFNICVLYGDYVQGMTLSQCNCAGSGYFVVSNAGDHLLTQLTITGSQFATSHAGVITYTLIPATLITNNLIINIAASGFGLDLIETEVFCITGNTFIGIASSDFAINVQTTAGGFGGTIVGNTFYNWTTAVNLQATANGINVQSNAYFACANSVINAGTNTIGGGSA